MKNERGVPVDWLGYCYYLPLIATFQQVWLEFVMSDFRRAKPFDVKPMMFESFCLKIRLTLTPVWIFEANWLVWL